MNRRVYTTGRWPPKQNMPIHERGYRLVVSKRVVSEKFYKIFNRIKRKRSGTEAVGRSVSTISSRNMMPGSTENGTQDKGLDGRNHQEAAENRTPLVEPSSDEQQFWGVIWSTNNELSENRSLPSHGSNRGKIREMPKPQRPVHSIQIQSERYQVLNKANEEEVDHSSAKGKN